MGKCAKRGARGKSQTGRLYLTTPYPALIPDQSPAIKKVYTCCLQETLKLSPAGALGGVDSLDGCVGYLTSRSQYRLDPLLMMTGARAALDLRPCSTKAKTRT